MEACLRGFSFMAQDAFVDNLKYVETPELERTWKATRRARLKQQEQTVWEEFVKEQDVLQSVCKDDPYQFLDQLPEPCLRELLDDELLKMQKEKAEEIEEPNAGVEFQQDNIVDHHVLFADDTDKEENEVFHIFVDENEDDVSGPEVEALNDSLGSLPVTVREKFDQEEISPSPMSALLDSDKSGKSSENVVGMIENSIYCAKIKDLRMKINEEMLSIITAIECQDVMNIDPDDLKKMKKRSAEFCTRFNRIRLYQLQRQLDDINRNNNAVLPFAKHTHFQSQMVRITSLHQNLLQALQVFHKWVCGRGGAAGAAGAGSARSLAAAARGAAGAGGAAPALADTRVHELFSTCDKLEVAFEEYANKISGVTSSCDIEILSLSKKCNKKKKGWIKDNIGEPDRRLSMYSLETLRAAGPRSVSSKGNYSSGTSKKRGKTKNCSPKTAPSPKSQRKSPPRRGRPLMRAPGGPRRAPPADVHTMVETVEVCTPSHVSREQSPQPCSNFGTPGRGRRSREQTPRTARSKVGKKSQPNTPRKAIAQTSSPKAKNRCENPKLSSPKRVIETALNNITSDNDVGKQISPVHKSPVQVVPKLKIPGIITSNCNKKEGKKGDKEIQRVEELNFKVYCVKNKDTTLNEGKNANELLEGSRTIPPPKEMRDRKVDKCDKDINATAAPLSERKSDRDKNKMSDRSDASPRCEVSTLLKLLCGGDTAGNKGDQVSGVKNAQLFCIGEGSPRQQPSTSQLLRILEETIQKKAPKPHFYSKPTTKDFDKLRMPFHIPEKKAQQMFQYRTKFVQHMLRSSMYANSVIGKPWEMIGSVSEQIIDDLLMDCARDMELKKTVKEMLKFETL